MVITIDYKKTANLLKKIVNQSCVDGFRWYEDVGELPNMFDIHNAIKVLEQKESEQIVIVEE